MIFITSDGKNRIDSVGRIYSNRFAQQNRFG